jgi:hypothetical protein
MLGSKGTAKARKPGNKEESMTEFGPDNTPRSQEQVPSPGIEGFEEFEGFEVLIIPSGRFPLGQLVATPGALAALEEAGVSPAELLGRHLSGDWGTLDEDDWAANDRALLEGTRLLSAYILPQTNERIWIITEWDRSATTLLLPGEY